MRWPVSGNENYIRILPGRHGTPAVRVSGPGENSTIKGAAKTILPAARQWRPLDGEKENGGGEGGEVKRGRQTHSSGQTWGGWGD